MNLEDYLCNSLTEECHQSYVKARQDNNMDFIADFEDWVTKTVKLEQLKTQDRRHTWENSEHNPANYSEYQHQDATTKEYWNLKGQIAYNEDQSELDNQIRTLEALLTHPDKIEQSDILLDE